MGKERNSSKTDANLETLLTRRAELQAELAAVEKQISDLQNQKGKPSAPVEQVVQETKKGLQETKPTKDLTKLTAEELLARKKTLSEQIDQVELNIRRVEWSIEGAQRDIKELSFRKDQSSRGKHEDSLKQLDQEKIALQDQLSVLKVAYSEVENAIEQNPQAKKTEKITALKNRIELKKSELESYGKEKAKQEHYLRRGLADENFTQNSDTARYFKDGIESADQVIIALSAELEKLERELAKLE